MSGAGGDHQPAGTRPGLISLGWLGWLAALGISSSILIMIVASATSGSATVPPLPRPTGPLPDHAGSVLLLHPHWLATLAYLSSFRLMPLALFVALASLVWLCLSRAWNIAARPAVSDPDVPALQRATAPDQLIRWPARWVAGLIPVGGRDSGTVLPAIHIAH